MRETVLIADDEKPLRESLACVLRDDGFRVLTANDGLEACDYLCEEDVDVALVDIRMPKKGGMEILEEAQELCPDTEVIIITAFGSVENAVEAVKKGAGDYVAKPLVFDDILLKVERLLQFRRLTDENQFLHTELGDCYSAEGIVGVSESLQDVVSTVKKLAQTRTSALITGESGVGKELVARAIHYSGLTSDGKFVPVNCSALPDSLVESELFGHRKGSFSGATADKRGRFQAADGGTIFLDELSCMPRSTQPKLLRAIEEKRILPIGATEPVDVNARILCASNVDLSEEVSAGRFRNDLYYRLNVVEVSVPPLRQRREDIPPLIEHFLDKFTRDFNTSCPGVTDEAMQAMMSYSWPGNVRELKNVIERALIFANSRPLDVQDLPFAPGNSSNVDKRNADLKSAVKAFERQHILQALMRHDYDKEATAEDLNIGLSSLYRKLKELDIDKKQPATN